MACHSPYLCLPNACSLNFVNTVLSKRKLTWFVNTNRVEGWNDARMPTVQGILRRGLSIEALKEFILSQGASRNITYQEWDKIWTINKKIIDPVCPRHTALACAGRVAVRLAGGPSPAEYVTVPRHPKNPSVGSKLQARSDSILLEQADAALLADGEEVTLMGWGNAIMQVGPAAGNSSRTATTLVAVHAFLFRVILLPTRLIAY